MFVNKSMTGDVITIHPDQNVIKAYERLKAHRIRHLPVVEKNNKLVGIVTDRDIRSVIPYRFFEETEHTYKDNFLVYDLKIKHIMIKNPVTISPMSTLQDAMLLLQKHRIGALPVVDEECILMGLLSIRDLLRAFINMMGIGQPGCLLGILVEDKLGQLKKIVDVITEEKISTGSVLVARHWQEGKRAVFPFLLAHDTVRVKNKLMALGFEIIDPLHWHIDELQKTNE